MPRMMATGIQSQSSLIGSYFPAHPKKPPRVSETLPSSASEPGSVLAFGDSLAITA